MFSDEKDWFEYFSDEKEKDEDTKENKDEEKKEELKRKYLHKTSSIFLRNLAPSITKQEVEAVSLSWLCLFNPFLKFQKWTLPFMNLDWSTDANRGFSIIISYHNRIFD